MDKKIKLIVSDLDGTLLNNAKRISDFTEKTLLDYQRQGYLVVLASGRFQKEIMRYSDQLKLKEFNGWIVCSNGYEVCNLAKQQVHTFDAIEAKQANDIYRIAEAYKLVQYVKINDIYHLKISTLTKAFLNIGRGILEMAQSMGLEKGLYATHLLKETVITKKLDINTNVYKMAFVSTPKKLERFCEQVDKMFPNTYSFYYVNSVSVEITRNTVSKKNAVEYICEQLKLDISQVIAFGDSGNDEPLLLNAGIGITMKNGTKRALAKAVHVSDLSNDQDGVAHECIKYL